MGSLKKWIWEAATPQCQSPASNNPLAFVVCILTEFLGYFGSATANLALFITRIKSLTLRCHFELSPWWSPGSLFPSSLTLERIRIVTPGPFTTFKGWKVLDDTFSDIDRYPALVELELCSLKVTEVGGKIMMRDTYERLCADEYLPRLKALGRLPVCSSARPVESVRPVVTFGSIADAYYKNSV